MPHEHTPSRNMRAEAALDVFGLHTASSPIITAFRSVANLERAAVFQAEDELVVLAPGKSPFEHNTVALHETEGWVTRDRLQLDIFLTPMSRFREVGEDPPEPFAFVQTGYGIAEGGTGFTVEANLPEDFDPTDDQTRWAIDTIMNVANLVRSHIEEFGKPPLLETGSATDEEAMQKMIGSLNEATARIKGRLNVNVTVVSEFEDK